MNNLKKKNILGIEDDVSFSSVLFIIAKNIRLLITIPLIFCFFNILYTFLLTEEVFTSKSKILSSSNKNSMSQAIGLAAQFGLSLPSQGNETKWPYSEILKSRTIAEGVVNKVFDTDKYGNKRSLIQILTYGFKEPKHSLEVYKIKAVDKLLGMVSVTENKKTAVYTIRVNATEPILAKEINNALIKGLDDHQKKYNKAKTSKTRKFIESRISNTEKDLLSAEEALKNFTDRNRRIENSPSLKLEYERLEREVGVLIGVFTTLKQQYETTKIEDVRESDYVVILDPPHVPLKSNGLINLIFSLIISSILGLGLALFISICKEYYQKIKYFEKETLNEFQKLFIKNLKNR
jgi:uncharacterized protein involved in exopolysaccharide biosynthesis